MTDEQRWDTLADPEALFDMLLVERGKVSPRKMRLLLVAWCRQVWSRLADSRSRNAVLVAEEFADGLATVADLKSAFEAMPSPGEPGFLDCRIARNCLFPDGWQQWPVLSDLLGRSQADGEILLSLGAQADILRDIFPDPWKPLSLAYHDVSVSALCLAVAAYNDRLPDASLDPVRLAILADALEEGGCLDQPLLDNLRGLEPCPGCSRGILTTWYGGGGGWCAYCHQESLDDCRMTPMTHHDDDQGIWKPRPRYRGTWSLDAVLGRE